MPDRPATKDSRSDMGCMRRGARGIGASETRAGMRRTPKMCLDNWSAVLSPPVSCARVASAQFVCALEKRRFAMPGVASESAGPSGWPRGYCIPCCRACDVSSLGRYLYTTVSSRHVWFVGLKSYLAALRRSLEVGVMITWL